MNRTLLMRIRSLEQRAHRVDQVHADLVEVRSRLRRVERLWVPLGVLTQILQSWLAAGG